MKKVIVMIASGSGISIGGLVDFSTGGGIKGQLKSNKGGDKK